MREGVLALHLPSVDLKEECARLDRAWARFLAKEEDPHVCPLIMQSWRRCSHQGLDAMHNRTPLALSDEQIRRYQETEPVFAEAKPVLASLIESALDAHHLLVFCDVTGNIVFQEGESWLQRRADAMNFVAGSSWNEGLAGTNAIGTAIATGTPVQVFASEHYCHDVHPWTCSAAPILDPATQRVLGVVDLTGLREAFHPHTLAVVITAARLIEERLRNHLELDRFRLLERYLNEISHAPSGFAILDRGLRVVKASAGFHENGWIDRNGRLIGCPIHGLNEDSQTMWEKQQPGAQRSWSFEATTCVDHGRATGVIVRVVNNGTPALTPSFISGHARSADNINATKHCCHTFGALIGKSSSFLRVISVARSAGNDLPVLIEGETGTGKELIAQAIHSNSRRAAGPFVAVNCAAVPHDLAIAEFFGFEGGTFTGAAKDGRIGKFEQASKGTIFLDEIGDMPLDMQALLLRVIEEREVVHVGGRKTIPLDVRVIAATNQNLLAAVERRSFRRDLYYRLNVIRIEMPPLRDRPEDFESLLEHFRLRASKIVERPLASIAPDAMRVLRTYSWPGNVRELRNVAERLATVESETICEADLPSELRCRDARKQDAQGGQVTALRVQEAEMIRSALDQCEGNVADAARRLGINRSTIYRKLGKSLNSK